MNKYQIVERQKDFILVIGLSFESPLSDLSEIERELEQSKYRGSVVFDLLLANGIAFNRFVKLHFENGRFERDTFDVIESGNVSLIEASKKFIKNNKDVLNYGILSALEKSEILESCN